MFPPTDQVIIIIIIINSFHYYIVINNHSVTTRDGYVCKDVDGTIICERKSLLMIKNWNRKKELTILLGDYELYKYSRGLAGGLGAIVSMSNKNINNNIINNKRITINDCCEGLGVLVAFFAIAMLAYHWNVFISKYGTFYCGVILTGVCYFF